MTPLLSRKMGLIPAFTMVESLVAMALVVVTFGLGMSLYLQLLSQDRILEKTKLQNLVQQELSTSLYEKQYYDEQSKFGALIISREILSYSNSPIKIMRVSAGYDEALPLFQAQELILDNE